MVPSEDDVSSFLSLLKRYQSKSPQVANRNRDRRPPAISVQDDEYEKNNALRKALLTLSSIDPSYALDRDETEAYVLFFADIYGGDDGYRHMYSKICELMYGFFDGSNNNDEGVPFRAVNLASNMAVIVSAAKKRYGEDAVTRCVQKLQDHIELENTRMYYMAKQNEAQRSNAERLSRALDGLDGRFSETQEKLQRNYVAILGIFAAIVVCFTGGLSFSTSVLESIDVVSIYRLAFVILVVALFLFDLIAAMFLFICIISGFQERKCLKTVAIVTNVTFVALIVLAGIARRIMFFG